MSSRIVKLSLVVPFAAAFAGCGYGSGFLHDAASTNQHQYRMDIASVRYVRSVAGAATTGSVLCAIPVTGGALYMNAMAQLHFAGSLKPNEILEHSRGQRNHLLRGVGHPNADHLGRRLRGGPGLDQPNTSAQWLRSYPPAL